MATEVNQNYFAWPQDESSAQDISQGTTQLLSHGSISFGRFDLESLEWEKWSVFTNDRRHEEFVKFNGLVAKQKAYFEEYFKRVRELKALQQQNQQTELNLDYSGDGSDSSQTGEDEPAADHGAPCGSGTPVNDSREQKIPTTTFEHEVECNSGLENGNLVNEISSSTYSSSVVELQQIGKQVRGSVSDSTDISVPKSYLIQDGPGMAKETTLTPKRAIVKEPLIGQASKIIPKAVKTASNNVPARTIALKGPCSGNAGMINQITKPERRPRGATFDLIGTMGESGITGLQRPSSAASQRPSTRERRPVTRGASRKPAEVTTPCRPSTSERRSATRESALKHANNTTPRRPSTPDRSPITKDLAPKKSNIVTPGRPSTANRRATTKETAAKLPSIATPCRPSTADRRLATKESETKQSNINSPHRPSTGERHPTTRDMAIKHVGIGTPCRPSTGKQCPATREGARKHADVVTLRRPSTAERRPITRDVAAKLAIVTPPCRPSTAERRPIAKDVAPKHLPSCRPSTAERRPVARDVAPKHLPSCRPSTAERRPVARDVAPKHLPSCRPSTAERRPVARDVAPKHLPSCRPSTAERRPVARDVAPKHLQSCRPSTAERRPVTKESALRHQNVANSRWPSTPDRYLSKKSETSTPQRPSTAERRPMTNDNILKSDKETPIRLRAVPNCLKGSMFAAVTPRKAVTPNLVKSTKPENRSYAKEKVEVHVDGTPKSSPSNLPPRKIMSSNVRDDRVLDTFRKPNEGFPETMRVEAFASNNTTSLQIGSVKARAPIPSPPPPPPPPPRRPSSTERNPSSIERNPNANNLPASGRKPKASTSRWH